MAIVHHKFLDYQVHDDVEILILGTFNPNVPNGASFFYSRSRNYFWTLLPGCWGIATLKGMHRSSKESFLWGKSIGLRDIINSVDVPIGQEHNVEDEYIDDKVHGWNNVITLIGGLKKLKTVYFTRKTFTRVPNIRKRIFMIREHCLNSQIKFFLLPTPARFYNDAKQKKWQDAFQHHS